MRSAGAFSFGVTCESNLGTSSRIAWDSEKQRYSAVFFVMLMISSRHSPFHLRAHHRVECGPLDPLLGNRAVSLSQRRTC